MLLFRERVQKESELHPFSTLGKPIKRSNYHGLISSTQDFAERTLLIKRAFTDGSSRTDPPLYLKAAGQPTKHDKRHIHSFEYPY